MAAARPEARAGLIRIGAAVTMVVGIAVAAVWGGMGSPTSTQAQPGDQAAAASSPRALAGIEAIERRLGDKAPTGRRIAVLQVEGGQGDYMPNFRDASFEGVTITARSGASKTNGHANAVGRTLYGPKGLAPGVDQVHCMTTQDWMFDQLLNSNRQEPPRDDPARVHTHSWISQNGSPRILRRVDYLIDTRDVVVVAGVNNGRGSTVPALVGSAYNAIAVGAWNGNSSGGYTRVEGPGRCKPDIVAPGGLTSFATPVVAACVARLLETADGMAASDEQHRVAARAEVIKAVLLAGADKPEGWKQAEGKPLDDHYGAGRVRFDQSYDILTAGRQAPGAIQKRYGWDFQAVEPGGAVSWSIDSPRDLRELSVVVTFHRRIDGRHLTDLASKRHRWLDMPRMADFDLKLIALDDEGNATVQTESASRVDNTEHVYRTDLSAGRYRLLVERLDKQDEAWDMAIAWRLETAPK